MRLRLNIHPKPVLEVNSHIGMSPRQPYWMSPRVQTLEAIAHGMILLGQLRVQTSLGRALPLRHATLKKADLILKLGIA
jgi:hypothetical protein